MPPPKKSLFSVAKKETFYMVAHPILKKISDNPKILFVFRPFLSGFCHADLDSCEQQAILL